MQHYKSTHLGIFFWAFTNHFQSSYFLGKPWSVAFEHGDIILNNVLSQHECKTIRISHIYLFISSLFYFELRLHKSFKKCRSCIERKQVGIFGRAGENFGSYQNI